MRVLGWLVGACAWALIAAVATVVFLALLLLPFAGLWWALG